MLSTGCASIMASDAELNMQLLPMLLLLLGVVGVRRKESF